MVEDEGEFWDDMSGLREFEPEFAGDIDAHEAGGGFRFFGWELEIIDGLFAGLNAFDFLEGIIGPESFAVWEADEGEELIGRQADPGGVGEAHAEADLGEISGDGEFLAGVDGIFLDAIGEGKTDGELTVERHFNSGLGMAAVEFQFSALPFGALARQINSENGEVSGLQIAEALLEEIDFKAGFAESFRADGIA